jgi:2-polyprenyl-3-methyl-5-hydroxy-6-metoxy-1,4-benzoquinol methylase
MIRRFPRKNMRSGLMLLEERLPEALELSSWREEMDTMADYIKQEAATKGKLSILEAGCVTMWALDLWDVQYTLTGVDMDKDALDIRKNQQRDLDICIIGDLRTVRLDESAYDVIYSSYVLEHVDGA